MYLKDENPSVRLFGFLCNLTKRKDLKEHIKAFPTRIKGIAWNEFSEYLSELVIISRLKDFSDDLTEVYQQMDMDIKLEEHPLIKPIYQRGKIEGKIEAIKKILQTRFPQ